MPRVVFSTAQLAVPTTRISSAAIAQQGSRVFLGTSEGALLAYDVLEGERCVRQEVLRPATRDRRPLLHLQVVESWRAIICVSGTSTSDATLLAFDMNTSSAVAQMTDLRGCCRFTVHEGARLLAAVHKRKINLHRWEGRNLFFVRELVLEETPRCAIFAMDAAPNASSSSVLCLAFRRRYSLADASGATSTSAPVTLLEMDREQSKPIALRLPRMAESGLSRLLLSNGAAGLVFAATGEAGELVVQDERFAWSEPPMDVVAAGPFLLSLNTRCVEVHDATSQHLVQTIAFTHGVAMSVCGLGRGGGDQVLCATAGSIVGLRMLPLGVQVEELVAAGVYEDALNLCAAVQDKELMGDIDEQGIHERFAHVLYSRGDFEAAVEQYVKARTPPLAVLSLFPALLPPSFDTKAGGGSGGSGGSGLASKSAPAAARALQGAALSRAAAAVAVYLEAVRPAVRERLREPAPSAASTPAAVARAQLGLDGAPASAEGARALPSIIDTVFVNALLACDPERRRRIIALLSGPNDVSIEDCAPVLAARGAPYAEALVWLYRSRGEHARALRLVTEDRCVGQGGWTPAEMHRWLARYLRWLWTGGASVESAAEDVAVPLTELLDGLERLLARDPELGMQVLVGGAAVGSAAAERVAPPMPHEQVVDFLCRASGGGGGGGGASSMSMAARYMEFIIYGSDARDAAGNGDGRGAALRGPAVLHDRLALTLLEALVSERREGGDAEAALALQGKLQRLLGESRVYDAHKLLHLLPSDLEVEHALLLSRLGRHREVLRIYLRKLGEARRAEAYCERIWQRAKGEEEAEARLARDAAHPLAAGAMAQDGGAAAAEGADALTTPDADVYLDLLAVYLETDGGVPSGEPLRQALNLLEKHFARLDPIRAIRLLPRGLPLGEILGFLRKALRFSWSECRRQQVVRQLLRVQEVKVQQDLIAEKVREVVVTDQTMCPVCNRPIGETAILRYPNGVVVSGGARPRASTPPPLSPSRRGPVPHRDRAPTQMTKLLKNSPSFTRGLAPTTTERSQHSLMGGALHSAGRTRRLRRCFFGDAVL